MTFSPVLVILVTAVITLGIIFYLEHESHKKKVDKTEGVVIFGERVTTQDYFSLCNTCIAYLMIDEKKRLNMSLFIDKDKLLSDEGRESMHMIAQTINLFPIIACKWEKDGILVVDEEETIRKTEEYQKNTQSDDYCLPLFDVGLISRAPGLFNISTRYQQAKTVEKILKTRGIGDEFEYTEEIVRGLSKIAMGSKRYKPAEVLYSDRNIQTI